MTTRGWLAHQHEVEAILDRRQARFTRVVKPQPPNVGQCGITFEIDKNNLWRMWCIPRGRSWSAEAAGWTPCHCPFGVPGGLLTVKERLYRSESGVVTYEIDHIPVMVDGEPETWRWQCESLSSTGMPLRASRLTLRVTNVTVVRVQEINGTDCMTEGILLWDEGPLAPLWFTSQEEMGGPNLGYDCPIKAYRASWDARNAKSRHARRNPYTHKPELCQVAYPWDNIREETTINHKSSRWHGCKIYICGNPWVWIVKFTQENV